MGGSYRLAVLGFGRRQSPSREAVFAVGGVDESQELCAGSTNGLLQRRLTLKLPRNLMFDGIDAAMCLAGAAERDLQ
jgi:hypothetical protein